MPASISVCGLAERILQFVLGTHVGYRLETILQNFKRLVTRL